MTPESILDLFRQGLYLIIMLSGTIIVPALIVGLCVAMFQAATQINEMSLSFVPKLLITFATLIIAGPWMLNMLVGYTQMLITQIPTMIG